jgi:serine/threonine protein phosphatase PrpC
MLAARATPVRERHWWSGLVVALRADQGLVRERMEDAWRLLRDASAFGRPTSVAALFDGLGGHPNGREAATAAAEHLPEALARARESGHLLGHLNNYVRPTQGLTTAVIALLPPGEDGHGQLITIGDSAAYAVEAGELQRLSPQDRDGTGRVTGCLGLPEVEGHVVPFRIPRGGTLLLCTDGVDGVAEPAALERALRAPDAAAALEDLLADVYARGAPDNATAILLRRTA